MENLQTIGDRVRYIREEVLELTQDELGAKLGVGGAAVQTYESGKSTIPTERLMKLAKLGGVSTDWICWGVIADAQISQAAMELARMYDTCTPEFKDAIIAAVLAGHRQSIKFPKDV